MVRVRLCERVDLYMCYMCTEREYGDEKPGAPGRSSQKTAKGEDPGRADGSPRTSNSRIHVVAGAERHTCTAILWVGKQMTGRACLGAWGEGFGASPLTAPYLTYTTPILSPYLPYLGGAYRALEPRRQLSANCSTDCTSHTCRQHHAGIGRSGNHRRAIPGAPRLLAPSLPWHSPHPAQCAQCWAGDGGRVCRRVKQRSAPSCPAHAGRLNMSHDG